MWPYNSRNTLFQHNVVGTRTFQYNYSYGNAGGFYPNCISNCAGGATSANVILRYNIAQDDCRMGGSSTGTGKHYIYNNTFYCPSRTFLDDMTGPREVRNNLFVAPGGSLKTASALIGTTRILAVCCRPTGRRVSCSATLGWWLAAVGNPRWTCPGTGCCPVAFIGYRRSD